MGVIIFDGGILWIVYKTVHIGEIYMIQMRFLYQRH